MGRVSPSPFLLFLKMVSVFLEKVPFCVNFRMFAHNYKKSFGRILIGIALSLQISFEEIEIFTMLEFSTT
jgi:hypothetical protein